MHGLSKDHLEHLSEEELDGAIDQAQSDEESYLVRRLCLIENIYLGDTLTEAATRVDVTTPAASRWVDRWNNDTVDGHGSVQISRFHAKLSELIQSSTVSAEALLEQFEKQIVRHFVSRKIRSTAFRFPCFSYLKS